MEGLKAGLNTSAAEMATAPETARQSASTAANRDVGWSWDARLDSSPLVGLCQPARAAPRGDLRGEEWGRAKLSRRPLSGDDGLDILAALAYASRRVGSAVVGRVAAGVFHGAMRGGGEARGEREGGEGGSSNRGRGGDACDIWTLSRLAGSAPPSAAVAGAAAGAGDWRDDEADGGHSEGDSERAGW